MWAALARAAAPSSSIAPRSTPAASGSPPCNAIDDAAFLPGGAKYDDLPGFLALAARAAVARG